MPERQDELSVEREIADDELATAIARALGVDRERIVIVPAIDASTPDGIVVEKRPWPGDFALRLGMYRLPDDIDRVMFYRELARLLGCKLLVDDFGASPYTAMLVAADGAAVRVELEARDDDAIVIKGLHAPHYGDDEVPDVLRPGGL